ncbi:hypothetical protein L1987_13553 [Smallanthus sonchifolius]|uniref:Uncharacterized protein n=1 Tax=Smallanthus sonchifolius TaxID=185202 RepID=A0ACB9JHD2_9ASTR|nr:hypothetical protein L1987_13553 [Smallanthus sonchifolius]
MLLVFILLLMLDLLPSLQVVISEVTRTISFTDSELLLSNRMSTRLYMLYEQGYGTMDTNFVELLHNGMDIAHQIDMSCDLVLFHKI